MEKKKILVVDDEEIVRYSLVNILKGQGYDVDGAPSAEKALEFFHGKKYHLVLTDLVLEGMGGLEMQSYGQEQKRIQEVSAIAKTTVTLSDRINTPLNIILGNIEMLQMVPDLEKDDRVRQTLKVMEEQIFRIKEVMDKLAKLTTAETRKYTALRDYEIIDLTMPKNND